MNNWCSHKVKQRIYIKEYIDIETGEILEEENFKKNYTLIKTTYEKSYVGGEKIDVSKSTQEYNRLLKWYQRKNKQLGCGDIVTGKQIGRAHV